MILPGLGLALALAAAAVVVPAEPRLSREAGGAIVLDRLPPILADAEVARPLGSGLTTTVVLRVELPAAGGPTLGGARIEVRYEPWDEVYLAAVLEADGRAERTTLAGAEALATWWSGLRLTVLAPSAPSTGPLTGPARVTIEVLPFSEAEGDDTQRWFSEALEGAAGTAAEEVGETASGGGGLRRALHLLIATSIQRGAVASYAWRVPVVVRREAGR